MQLAARPLSGISLQSCARTVTTIWLLPSWVSSTEQRSNKNGKHYRSCCADDPTPSQKTTIYNRNRLRHPNSNQLNIGHIFHRKLDALTAKSALSVSTIGHVIRTEVGCVIDNDSAKIQTFDCLQDSIHIIGKYANLQTKFCIICLL